MSKIFLDANFLITWGGLRESGFDFDHLHKKQVYISTLSIHIFCYIAKIKLPDLNLTEMLIQLNFVPLNEKITLLAIKGPTPDFEDNVQLHSAVDAECDVFLTSDQQLLNMRYFGKMEIVENLNNL